jgi:hypothetical protein
MAEGPRGPTGVTGIQGRKGLQGTPFGPQGTNLFGRGGRIPLSTTSNNPIVVTSNTYGTNYLVGTVGPIGPQGIPQIYGLTGYITTVQLPASMISADAGAYWVFKNNTGSLLQVELSNGTANYKGNNSATTLFVGINNSLGLAYSGSGTSYIAL